MRWWLKITLVAAVSLVFVGCGSDDDGSEPDGDDSGIAGLECAKLQFLGDSDCDGIKDAYDRAPGQDDFYNDSDGDHVADAFDRLVGRDDLADDDADGILNRFDSNPFDTGSDYSAAATQVELVGSVELQELNRVDGYLVDEPEIVSQMGDAYGQMLDTLTAPDIPESDGYSGSDSGRRGKVLLSRLGTK